MTTKAKHEHTAVHEAGHAVLQVVLGIGHEGVTIVPNHAKMEAGHSLHGGEYAEKDSRADMLRTYAEDAFWLRHAIACYAGAEAVRQLRPQDDAEGGAESDTRWAEDAVNRITEDPMSLELWFALGRRRCALLVEYYRPEIKAVAAVLMNRRTLSADEVQKLVDKSLLARHGKLLSW